jgi:hypothetical protein
MATSIDSIDVFTSIYGNITNITMENHHFHGKTHCNWPFSIAMLNYQRVNPNVSSGERYILGAPAETT